MLRSHRLYVGTIGNGLWRSTDGGVHFERACDGMFVECHVRALAVHPQDPRILYLGTEQGLFRSRDGADNWERVESPLNGQQLWSILLLPDAPDTILVGTCPSRIYRSADGGRSWNSAQAEIRTDCPRILHTRVTTLTAEDSETLWAGVEIDGLRRSRDAGRTWEKVGTGLSSQDIHSVVVVPRGNGRPKQLLASTNNDVNLSVDDGATWQPLGLGKVMPSPYFRGLAQRPGQPEFIYLGNGDAPPGTVGTVARSQDGGRTWQEAPLPSRANSTIWNFGVHAVDPELVYAYSISGQVYRSVDSGGTWEKLQREFGEIRALAWTP